MYSVPEELTGTAAVMYDFSEGKERFVDNIDGLIEAGVSEKRIWEAYKFQHGLLRGYLDCMAYVIPGEEWIECRDEYNALRRAVRGKVSAYVETLHASA